MEMKGKSPSGNENGYEILQHEQVTSQENTAGKCDHLLQPKKTTCPKVGLHIVYLAMTIAFASASIALFAKVMYNEKLQEQSLFALTDILWSRNKADSLWGLGGFTASNGFKYKITKTSQNFQDSRDACARMGGHLAYKGVRNAKIHSEILHQIGSGWSEMYIDLRDVEVEGHFRWGDGVLASTGWMNWIDGQPANYAVDENCVQIEEDYQSWNDISCSTAVKALCEQQTNLI